MNFWLIMYENLRWQSEYWIVSKFLSPKRHNRGKTQWTIKSCILQSSHIMILNSTKFCGNRIKDVEVGLSDGRTDGQTDRFLYTPPLNYVFAGGIKTWIACRNHVFVQSNEEFLIEDLINIIPAKFSSNWSSSIRGGWNVKR